MKIFLKNQLGTLLYIVGILLAFYLLAYTIIIKSSYSIEIKETYFLILFFLYFISSSFLFYKKSNNKKIYKVAIISVFFFPLYIAFLNVFIIREIYTNYFMGFYFFTFYFEINSSEFFTVLETYFFILFNFIIMSKIIMNEKRDTNKRIFLLTIIISILLIFISVAFRILFFKTNISISISIFIIFINILLSILLLISIWFIYKKIKNVYLFIFMSIFVTSLTFFSSIVINHTSQNQVFNADDDYDYVPFNTPKDNCNGRAVQVSDEISAKPAIYIYPKKEMNIHVSVNLDGKLTKVIPEYNNGWDVRVKPNGDMKVIGGNSQITYDYLFYEDILYNIQKRDTGWIIKKEDREAFFKDILPKLGLIEKESKEFIDYWVPKLANMKGEYIEVYLFNEKFFKEHWQLNIEPKPEKVLRLEFHFKGLDKKRKMKEPKITKFDRTGYYAVEWGGTTEGLENEK